MTDALKLISAPTMPCYSRDNAKALATFMGHSWIKVTFDLYGHLMPGTEAEAAALLDTFLDRDQ
jgi:hypothetical protein